MAGEKLSHIPIEDITRNRENPRILFRQAEMENLLESIRRYGIQVPISVYQEGDRFVLIDGERRLRCAKKLNLYRIPAIVQGKPDALTNLLLMFNIHALREQWDYLTFALKLPRVIQLLKKKNGWEPTEAELAVETGLTRGMIRRSKLLMNLPEEYRQTILEELKKPKVEQKLTEDFFIEMERSLKTVENAMPSAIPEKDIARKVLIEKFSNSLIPSVTAFRDLAKIARAEYVEADRARAEIALRKVLSYNTYTIEAAFNDSVSEAYHERDIVTRVNALLERLQRYHLEDVDDELRFALAELISRVSKLLEAAS